MVCLRPLNCYGQLRASRPPPLLHRVPIRAAAKKLLAIRRTRRLYRITPGPFQSRVGRRLEYRLWRCLCRAVRLSLAVPGPTYEPLYVIATMVATDIAR